MPVFFGLAGLSADLSILKNPDLLLLTLGLILIASIGKFAGAFAGGWLGGLSRAESLALACGMNARGSTEVIVATIGLSMGALSQNLFTMIVAMAVVTTMAMPPMLRWALRPPAAPGGGACASGARGLRGQGLRDQPGAPSSRRGQERAGSLRLAARGLAGRPARHAGHRPPSRHRRPAAALGTPERDGDASRPPQDTIREADSGAKPPRRRSRSMARVQTAPTEEAVASEARKGYDLLVIGVEPVVAPEGGFHPEVARIARGFEGPLAVAVARGAAGGGSAPSRASTSWSRSRAPRCRGAAPKWRSRSRRRAAPR